MKVHLVGGYPGSGKSTAIDKAVRLLSDKNIKASVIKDDQVDFVLDASPVQKIGAPFARITGGCSCCNYTQLDSQIEKLKKKSNPSVIFAEYSGTCTGLISGLLKPLKDFRRSEIEVANYSTFIDADLLMKRLQYTPLDISAEREFLLSRHIEEAEIFAVSKSDLLSSDDLALLKSLIADKFPLKQGLLVNSRDNDSINKWLELVSYSPTSPEGNEKNADAINSAKVDSALLDEELQINTKDNSAVEQTFCLIRNICEELKLKKMSVEHFNFLLSFDKKTIKVTNLQLLDSKFNLPIEKSHSVDLLINARIQTTPDELRKILLDQLGKIKVNKNVEIKVKFISYLQQ
jgi:G3E family GTPase